MIKVVKQHKDYYLNCHKYLGEILGSQYSSAWVRVNDEDPMPDEPKRIVGLCREFLPGEYEYVDFVQWTEWPECRIYMIGFKRRMSGFDDISIALMDSDAFAVQLRLAVS